MFVCVVVDDDDGDGDDDDDDDDDAADNSNADANANASECWWCATSNALRHVISEAPNASNEVPGLGV